MVWFGGDVVWGLGVGVSVFLLMFCLTLFAPGSGELLKCPLFNPFQFFVIVCSVLRVGVAVVFVGFLFSRFRGDCWWYIAWI